MSHLTALPFFEKTHEDLRRALFQWSEKELSGPLPGATEAEKCRNLVQSYGEAGWLRSVVPKAWGGSRDQLDVRSICLSRETLSQFSGLADFAFAMQGLSGGPISLFGSDELRQRYLPGLAKGTAIGAFAASESDAGSDLANIALAAEKIRDGYVLNGSKTWISNAGHADFYVVFARTDKKARSRGLSAFVVDADLPGIQVTTIDTLSPHPLGTITFSDCRVAADQQIGQPGEGMKIALGTLDVFRPTVGAAALGMARRALAVSLERCQTREIFGKSLGDYQLTRAKIADMVTEIDASALLVYRAAWNLDIGRSPSTAASAMAKMYATEAAQRVIDQALQLFGAAGVVAGSATEQLYRDIRPLRIYEGTTEIQKLIIAKAILDEHQPKR